VNAVAENPSPFSIGDRVLTCWNCGESLENRGILCSFCGVPLDFSGDYFELFGLEIGYDIDLDALETAYFKHQMRVHPDKFSGASTAVQIKAVSLSSTLNYAYNSLNNNVKRGVYLLGLWGFDDILSRKGLMPAGLMMQQFELRERADNEPDKAPIKQDVLRQIDACHTILSNARAADDSSLKRAVNALFELQFLTKFLKEIT